MPAPVFVADVHTAAMAELTTAGGFPARDVHDGKVINPTLIAGTNQVQPYAMVLTAPGWNPEQPLAGPDGGQDLRIYVTVAAATPTKVLDAADRARAALDGAWLAVSGHQIGVTWLTGYYPPPPNRAADAPDRWFIPLIFSALI